MILIKKIFCVLNLKALKLKNNLQYIFHKYFLYFSTLKIKVKLQNKKNIQPKVSKKIVIFGSSASINQITEQEKALLNECKIIFMNKNLIFWKKINIWPDYFFLADTPIKSKAAKQIFEDTIKTLNSTQNDAPIFLIEEFYKFGIPKNLKKICFQYNKSSNLVWAQNLNETMFGFHGSLTTLLNLTTVLNFGKRIMLVGFDMNDRKYFFDKDSNFNKYKDDSFTFDGNFHPNAEKINGKNIFTHWNLINKNIRNNNISLYCESKKSLLVKKGLVKHLSINDFYRLK
tara:strand:- start:116 stop:973 length:858 start_codon:yes stop_codon:yes gene_type:complete